MGGGIALGLAVLQAGAGVVQGIQAEQAADLEASGIELQAEADVAKINRELDSALAMQSAIFGSQGRVLEGSAKAVQEGDIKEAKKDIESVRKGAAMSATATRQAGQTAKFGAIAGGLLGGVGTYSSLKQIG